MSWGGTMKCYIVNQTGGTITKVSFAHQWNGAAQAPLFSPTDPFENGEQVELDITVGPGSADDWSVQFNDAQGKCWYRNNKQCDVSQSDFESGKPVYAILKPGNVGFSIDLPVSQSCKDNYYDSCDGDAKT
jgi:hypothetical protein